MPVTINGTTGIAGPDGSASTPAVQGTDSNTGLFYPAADTVALSTGGSERMRITSGGVVMVGATSAHGSEKVLINGGGTSPTGDGYLTLRRGSDASSGSGLGVIDFADTRTSSIYAKIQAIANATPGTNDFPGALVFYTTADGASTTTERMRITSGGYFKASNNGSYYNAGASWHEFVSTEDNTALLINSNSATLSTSGIVFIEASRNTTNNSFYALSYYNSGASAYKLRVADSGAIATAGGIALGTVTPATSGVGVQFPATQSASSDANTLDDYEEGTWTPTLTGASSDPTVTYTTQTGQYTKVGRVVHVQCSIVPATYSGGSGVLRIAGLPFTSGSSTFYVTGSAYLEGVDIGASRTWATSYVAPGVSYIRVITSQNNGAASDVLVGGVSAGDNFIIGITYMV